MLLQSVFVAIQMNEVNRVRDATRFNIGFGKYFLNCFASILAGNCKVPILDLTILFEFGF